MFLWFVFFRIRTEYGDLRSKSLYSVQIRENTDQKKLRIWTLFTQCYILNMYKLICKLTDSVSAALYKIKEKSLKLVSLPHFLHDFWRKVFLTLYFIHWPNFIVWLSLFLEILDSMCIVTISLTILWQDKFHQATWMLLFQ